MPRPYEGHYLTEEKKKVVEDNMHFLWYYYKKHITSRYRELNETQKEEIVEALHWGICLAAEAWEEEKGKFTTICQWYFKSVVTNYFRERSLFYDRYELIPFIHDDNIDEESSRNDDMFFTPVKKGGFDEDLDCKKNILWEDISFMFDEINMSPQEEEIVSYHYKHRFTLSEIGEMLCMSRERIRQIMGDIFERLKQYVLDSGLEYEDFVGT